MQSSNILISFTLAKASKAFIVTYKNTLNSKDQLTCFF